MYYGYNKDIIKLSRAHNDANVLSLGSRFLNKKDAIDAVKLWLKTSFTNESRHKRRVDKISNIG